MTLLRTLEYEAIDGTRFDGLVLDFGGGTAGYDKLFKLERRIFSINIAPERRPSLIADLTRPLPLADACADGVISLNTFEHLGADEVALAELIRVLKPGGNFLVVVPFLYHIHGSPNDHHRHTASEWERRLVNLGVPGAAIEIEPLAWDPTATAWALAESYGPYQRLRWLLRPLALLPGLIYWRPRRAADYAMGYVIRGRKPG
jgi:SAM-dependent methyltransferase